MYVNLPSESMEDIIKAHSPLFTAEQFAACGGEENIQEWLKEAEIYQIWLPIYFCTISL
mgnify:CR=1 FL=1